MYFKNGALYRLQDAQALDVSEFSAQLAKRPFEEVGPQDTVSQGWVSPRGNDELVHNVGGQWLICMQVASRILPGAVVKQEVAKRALKIEQNEGSKPNRRRMRELKDEVTLDLLPRAFVRTVKLYAWLDPKAGLMVIDTSSAARADDLMSLLFETVPTIKLRPLQVQNRPASVMAEWLLDGMGTHGYDLAGDCVLKSSAASDRSVTYRNGLDEAQIQEHLSQGKQPVSVSVTYNERVQFTLTEALSLRRIQMLDVVQEQADGTSGDEAFDAEFSLMAGELRAAVTDLIMAMGGESEIEEAPAASNGTATDAQDAPEEAAVEA